MLMELAGSDASVDRSGGIRARIVDAVLSWAATTGLRKLSMDEVARTARVGRATLYKYFPGRDALIAAVVAEELARFFSDVQSVVDRFDAPDDRLVYGFGHAYRLLRHHSALVAVLRVNPELLMPYVITDQSSALDLGRQFVESSMKVDDMPEHVSAQFAEHVARAFHTLILIPSSVLDLDAPDGPENYARQFLLPVRHHLSATVHL